MRKKFKDLFLVEVKMFVYSFAILDIKNQKKVIGWWGGGRQRKRGTVLPKSF